MCNMREVIERLRSNMIIFLKGLYRLLTKGSNKGDKLAAIKFI